MCGIGGWMTRDGRPPEPGALDRLQAALAHRGPDAAGRHLDGGTALIHTRLSIVDLVTGDQPLFGAAGAVLVANGEIYNDPELRAQNPAMPWRTRSDCEPAVYLYEKYGTLFAQSLRGMYAIAIWDARAQKLVLARDPFGIKPLYYTESPDGFAFASEPAALIAAGAAAAGIDTVRRAELLQLKFTTGSETIFPAIRRVLPGETLVIEAGRITARSRRPALPEGGPLHLPHAAALARIEEVLSGSVSVHLRSDVPYGLFLSGGIDSAALLALMTRVAGTEVRAITVGYPDAGDGDETREALRLARAAGAACERIEMTEADFWDFAPRIAASIDDPTADAAVLPTWMLGKAAASDRLKVTLCGEGGDEMFAGYSRYRRGRAPLSWIARKPRTRGVFDGLESIRPALAGWRNSLDETEARADGDGLSGVQRLQAIDCAEWLPNDLLTKLDRCLMAHGVEGRTPFVDPVVANYAFRLSDARKVGVRMGKLLLRDWLSRAMPEAGAFARKKGFKPPVGRWMQARAETLAKLVAAQPGIAEIVSATDVARAFSEAAADSQRAWSLLFYALWHNHHIAGRDVQGDVAEALSAR